MTEYDYTINPVAIDRLTQDIRSSAIVTSLNSINALGSAVSIFFNADLSDGDKTILDNIVAAHNGTPLPQNGALSVASISNPPYAAKTIMINGVTKKLYIRNTGFQSALTSGSNTITYTATYSWAKLIGVEVIGAEALDYVDFKVFDTATGTYSGTPNAMLNHFGFSVNIAPGFYRRECPYDADIYQGLVLKLTYNSVSAKTIGINILQSEVKS